MLKLLNAYFNRLFKWRIFQILMAVMLVVGVVLGLVFKDHLFVYQIPFIVSSLLFPIYIGVIIALFNYPFFTNGTIRNHITVGHERSSVFFADWAASSVFALVLYLILAGSTLGAAAIAGDASNVNWENIAYGLIISSLLVILFATISQLICVMLKGAMSFLATYLSSQLLLVACVGVMSSDSIPKTLIYFFPSVVCMYFNYFKDVSAPNPLIDASEGMSISETVASMTFEPLPAVLALIIEIAAVYTIGNLYFRKTDIK